MNWVFSAKFHASKNFLKIHEYPSVDDFEGKKRLPWCLNNVIYCEVIYCSWLSYAQSNVFTTTEENEAALFNCFVNLGFHHKTNFE